MSQLGKRLCANANKEAGERLPWLELLGDFFGAEKQQLEAFCLNEGRVNLILQTPAVSAVVVCWNEELSEYGHSHACDAVDSWVVRGSLDIDVQGEACERVQAGQGHSCAGAKQHVFRGPPGTVSVHVYNTEAMNLCSHPVRCNCTTNTQLVWCNETLSVTDAERGRSVAQICEASEKGAALCPKSLRLYTNFRDLIELLHHEVEPLEDGGVHSKEHIDKICGLLGAVRLNEGEFKRYLRFHRGAYTRNLVGYDVPMAGGDGHNNKAKFTVLILCWDKGQMSPIHDHAGSSCWVKVLKGQVREIRYDASVEPPRVRRDVTLGPQDVCYINDTQGVHAMGNPNPDEVAVSMHIYAPPYILCTLFDEATGSRRVGSMATARIPDNPFAFVPLGPRAEDGPVGLGEFYSLVHECLQSEREREVGALLERLALQEHEWREFVHFDPFRYTRSLVALDSKFSLMVCCWNSGQSTPIHKHGPGVNSWVKVLSGNMQLKAFDGSPGSSVLRECVPFQEGQLIDHHLFTGLHLLGNASDAEPAVTLHLFSPPIVHMAYLDSAGVDRVIPVVHSATSVGRCCAADPISSCDQEVHKTRSTRSLSLDESKSEGGSSHAGSAAAADSKLPSLTDQLSFFHQEQDQNIFTNLNAIIRFISAHDLTLCAEAQQAVMCLDRMRINREEWAQFLRLDDPYAPDSNLLAAGRHFRLTIRRIDPGEHSKRARLPERLWLKLLQGELTLTSYLEGVPVHSSTVTQSTGAFVSNKLECELVNTSERTACVVLELARVGE